MTEIHESGWARHCRIWTAAGQRAEGDAIYRRGGFRGSREGSVGARVPHLEADVRRHHFPAGWRYALLRIAKAIMVRAGAVARRHRVAELPIKCKHSTKKARVSQNVATQEQFKRG